MTWQAPITWTVGQMVTYSQLNSQIRDNMLETAPAKSTSGSWPQHFTVSATNSIAAREIRDNTVATSETTATTTYVDLATTGPSVTITTGSFALVLLNCSISNDTIAIQTRSSFDISGATTSTPTDGRGILASSPATYIHRQGVSQLMSVTAGSNVFKQQYRVSSNTGSFAQRTICVIGL